MTNEEVYGAITALLENAVDMEDEKHEEVFARTLAMLDENSMMHDISVEYEKKLKEVMGKEAFYEWATWLGKELWRRQVERMPDSEFKQFTLDNFDKITAEVDHETENRNVD